MTSLNFCEPCGEKRVKDVKLELEGILKKKQFDCFTCAICCSILPIKTEFTAIENEDEVELDIDIQTDTPNQTDISKTFHDLKQDSSEVEDQDENEASTVEEKNNDEDDEYNPSEESEESGDSDTRSNYSGEVRKKQKQKKPYWKPLAVKSSRNLPKQHKIRVPVLVKNCDLISQVQNMILEESSELDSLSCKVCKECFKRTVFGIDEFVSHINTHNADQEPILKPYQCPVCPDVFKLRSSLTQHQNGHKDKDKLQCPHGDCGRQFWIKGKLENHVKKMHSGVLGKKKKPHPEQAVCQICGIVLKRGKQTLKQHLLRHEGVKPHKCSVCNKSFFDHANMVRHEKIHTHQIKKNAVCELCGKILSTDEALKKHLLSIHSDERRHQCKFCPYRSKLLSTLKAHIQNIHTNSDPERCKCSICGEVFVSPGACTKHEQKHRNDQGGLELAALLKPHKCPDCGYRAAKPCQIKIHQRSHTGEKPHKCAFCGTGFVQTSQCNRHMKICKKRPCSPIGADSNSESTHTKYPHKF